MNLRSLRPSYALKRVGQMRFESSHPHAPWLAESAILLLDTYLKPTDVGFEWGSGRSTIWFAQRVSHLHSVEDNRGWYDDVRTRLITARLLHKVTYRFVPCDGTEIDEPYEHPYSGAVTTMRDNSLDFALVDGNLRAACIRNVVPKLKPGGMLILDNANRFIPNRMGSENSTVHEPRSEPRSPVWAQIMEQFEDWRWINTSNGIWDTRFWIKPCAGRNS
jgi:hypothetical protein